MSATTVLLINVSIELFRYLNISQIINLVFFLPNSLLRKWLYSSKTFNDVWKISTVLIRSKLNSLINHPSIRSIVIYFNTCDKILASWTLLHIPSVKSKILILIVIVSSYVVSIIEEFKGAGRTKMEVLEEWIILQNNYQTILPYGLNDRIRDEFKTNNTCTNAASKFSSLRRKNNRVSSGKNQNRASLNITIFR